MLALILKSILGDKNQQDIRKIKPIVAQIKQFEPHLQQLSNDELRAKTPYFRNLISDAIQVEVQKKEEIQDNISKTTDLFVKRELFQQLSQLEKTIDQKIAKKLDEILPEAFAVLKETARRFSQDEEIRVSVQDFDRSLVAKGKSFVKIEADQAVWKTTWQAGGNAFKWAMVHYDVQLIGGIVLHQGKIAEMQTGEGKTLVATLPVYLNALSGKGVHLVTVNDYLAKRDADWMGPIYFFHGLSVECIENYPPNSLGRKMAYQSDITFGTNNEFGFDYLRDNMASDLEELVQRKPYFAIVDEVDSVLIDEARTPLIISGPVQGGDIHHFADLKDKVEILVRSQQRMVTEFIAQAKKIFKDTSLAQLNKKEQEELGELLLKCHRGMPKNKAFIKLLSEPGMKALLQKVENYYLQDHAREMPKIDESLYFVLSEKQNSIDLTQKGIELVSKDVSEDFFILPDMATAFLQVDKNPDLDPQVKLEEKEEISQAYRIKSERIHTMSQLLKAYTLFEKDKEYVVMDNKVMIVDEQTGRMMEGRRYSDGLHQAIEAKEQVKIEASSQTYASVTLQNYFRMYEKLAGMTGTARTELAEFWEIYKLDVVAIPTNRVVTRKDYDDSVYKTIREKYNAVIVKIEEERAKGRACLVGTTSVEVSELLSRMLKQRGIPHNVLNAKYHAKEAEIISEAGREGAVTIATNMAGRGTDIKLSPAVKQNGGLVIIGTERHESRRIDLQLRGRAGRQGDPGDSYFFVSLEDDLMRMFGSDRIASVMDRLGIQEGEVIQHSMVTSSIQRAQKKVEENNFGVRKRLLEYDNVMNAQREIIYKRRKNALFQEELEIDIIDMFEHIGQIIAQKVKAENNPDVLQYLMAHKVAIVDFTQSKADLQRMSVEKLTEKITKKLEDTYIERKNRLGQFIYALFEKQDAKQLKNAPEQVLIPFTDGTKGIQIPVNIQKIIETKGDQAVKDLEQMIMISTIDFQWKEHLRLMDELRNSVQMAVHEQKDPLLMYKFQGFEAFNTLMYSIYESVCGFMMSAKVPVEKH